MKALAIQPNLVEQVRDAILGEISSGAPTLETHLTYTQRVMGEVLVSDEQPRDIWDQHAAILDAIAAGDGDRAAALTREHLTVAADFMVARLRSHDEKVETA